MNTAHRSARSAERDLAEWETHRPHLLGLAYRMLGDVARAEDMVQEAWIRWTGRSEEADDPRAYLVAVVTRLCLNELGSARARKEESRSDRLPEPVALDQSGTFQVEVLDDVSMALLVMLQRLTPSERAVLLLHDVFDFGHADIADLIGKTAPASRKLLERARSNIAAEKRLLSASREEHARLLESFVKAALEGDLESLLGLLADDAVLVTDGGPNGREVEGFRNLRAPLQGASRVAQFISTVSARGARTLERELRELNGRPALLFRRDGAPFAALMLGVAEGRIHRVYFQADLSRLRRI
ncbi:MAG: sigma-70 family RNA polymerase sigma factor [Polyangiaceae bacterium]|nr:sigma-70 family RNA polymerase sigma factor [Polyangiaceae bacterium]